MKHVASRSRAGAVSVFTLLVLSVAVAQSNPEVITPIDVGVTAPNTPAAEAEAAGRFVYGKPTPDNSIMLFIDHQIGLMSGVRDFTSLAEYKNNVVGLAKMAKALEIPVLLTTSNAQWQNGDILPELREVFPEETIYRRTGIINAYEDSSFRGALEDLIEETGRTHIIVSGVTLGTCVAFPTLAMLQDGYQVFPVVDASGAWSPYEAQAAMQRMTSAGAELQTVFALGAELQADWKNESANAMLEPFVENLPEYGFVVQNFWNNANQKVVEDPFGLVTNPSEGAADR